jgi:serine protease Do
MPPLQPQPHASGSGSGVVIGANGIILTNNHVVAGDGEVTVRLHDGREFKAVNVWTDPKSDVAVVKIDAKDLVAAKLGNSDTVSVGDWVLALGQPFGLQDTVTAGIISAKHRGIGITARENFLQTDAAINPGNSGGPLVNLDGEVVGINTAISSRSGGNNGVGFAIPVNLAKWVGDQLAAGGTVHRAYLGVGIQPVTATLAEQFKVKPREGVAVTDVFPNTPAAKAGLQSGDIIIRYAGVEVSNPIALQTLVERSQLNKPHMLTVVRDGKRMDLTFVPEEQPSEFGPAMGGSNRAPSKSESSQLEKLGLQVSELDEAVAEQLGMKGVEGVVITHVVSGGPADRAGLSSGMVITQVNRQAVKSLDGFLAAVKKAESGDGLLLLVRSQEGSRFVVVKK